jgi:hypothetical protein
MIRLANKQTTELWYYLYQGFKLLVGGAEIQPTSLVSQVSPRYKTQILLKDSVFRLRLLKNTIETNLDTDLIHEILIYFDKELDRGAFESVSCNPKTGKRNRVSSEYYLPNLLDYDLNHILTSLVENVATLKQVECLNLGVRYSGLGFDIVEEIRYE